MSFLPADASPGLYCSLLRLQLVCGAFCLQSLKSVHCWVQIRWLTWTFKDIPFLCHSQHFFGSLSMCTARRYPIALQHLAECEQSITQYACEMIFLRLSAVTPSVCCNVGITRLLSPFLASVDVVKGDFLGCCDDLLQLSSVVFQLFWCCWIHKCFLSFLMMIQNDDSSTSEVFFYLSHEFVFQPNDDLFHLHWDPLKLYVGSCSQTAKCDIRYKLQTAYLLHLC